MRFTDIPGLYASKQKLQKLVKNERIPHSMIISGPDGSGKLALALAFVSYVQCLSPIENEACGKCNACQKTFKLIHPDVHFYFPLSGKENTSDSLGVQWRKAVLENVYLNANHWQDIISKENKLLNINAEECRSMLKKLSLTIYEGNKRVLLIWLPEYLGKEGNILLKLIEEPPANSLILLISENPALLISTIQSRCQALSVPPFSDEEIRSQLILVPDEKIKRNIISTVEGNMYEALKMVEDQTNPQVEKMLSWLRICLKNDASGITKWSEAMAGEGRDAQRQFLQFGLRLIEYVFRYKITEVQEEVFQPEDWRGIKGLASQLSFENIEQINDLFNDHIIFIERNANPKILFTALSINLSQIFNKRQPELFHFISN